MAHEQAEIQVIASLPGRFQLTADQGTLAAAAQVTFNQTGTERRTAGHCDSQPRIADHQIAKRNLIPDRVIVNLGAAFKTDTPSPFVILGQQQIEPQHNQLQQISLVIEGIGKMQFKPDLVDFQ